MEPWMARTFFYLSLIFLWWACLVVNTAYLTGRNSLDRKSGTMRPQPSGLEYAAQIFVSIVVSPVGILAHLFLETKSAGLYWARLKEGWQLLKMPPN
jgi:hypothetical protein